MPLCMQDKYDFTYLYPTLAGHFYHHEELSANNVVLLDPVQRLYMDIGIEETPQKPTWTLSLWQTQECRTMLNLGHIWRTGMNGGSYTFWYSERQIKCCCSHNLDPSPIPNNRFVLSPKILLRPWICYLEFGCNLYFLCSTYNAT